MLIALKLVGDMTSQSSAVAASLKFAVLAGVAPVLLLSMPSDAQEVLPTIEVKRSPKRNPTVRNTAPAAAPAPAPAPAQPQESPYGEVQGYNATRTATGTKTDTPLQEVPQSITVVTSEAIRDIGALNVQEALRYVPGVFADAYGPDTRSDGPKVRGITAPIYLDGLRLNSGGYWNHTRADPFTLSRVEVLRGPGSVLYGDSPAGGLINMVSKRPQAQSHNEIGVQYGSFNWKQIQADSTGKLTPDGEWLYRIIGIFRDADTQTDFVGNDRQLVMPAITWQPTLNTKWTVIGLYQKDKTGSSSAFLPLDGTLFPNPNGKIPVNRFTSEPGYDIYQTTTRSVTSLFEHSFSNNFKVWSNARVWRNDGVYRTMYPDVYSGGSPYTDPAQQRVNRYVDALDTKRDAFASDTGGQFDFDTGAMTHKVLFGVDARQIKEQSSSALYLDNSGFNLYNPVYGQTSLPAGISLGALPLVQQSGIRQQVTGLYLQDQARFGPWLATAGVRRDKLVSEAEGVPSQENTATTKRFALMYETPFNINPYVSYSESFNPILGGNICIGGFCKPVRGIQYEAGFKSQPWSGASFNAAVFDITEKNRTASGFANLAVQLGESRIRGAEVEFIGSLNPTLDIIASYTYLDTEVTKGNYVGSQLENVPNHYASLWAKQKLTLFGLSGFTLGAGVRYVGENSSTGFWYAKGIDYTVVTPGNTLFDAMFAYENEHWRMQVTATNLGDKIYFASCLARGDCFYGNRRTVMGTVTYKF